MNSSFIIFALIVLAILLIAAIALGIMNTIKLNNLLEYSEEGDLIETLEKYYTDIRSIQKKLKLSSEGALSDRISATETKVNMSLSKTGIVNFDAFDDVHGKQSFALAVLNQYNDGFIITSIYGSSSSSTYVRSVKEGRSTTKLLSEEEQAIKKAVSGNIN